MNKTLKICLAAGLAVILLATVFFSLYAGYCTPKKKADKMSEDIDNKMSTNITSATTCLDIMDKYMKKKYSEDINKARDLFAGASDEISDKDYESANSKLNKGNTIIKKLLDASDTYKKMLEDKAFVESKHNYEESKIALNDVRKSYNVLVSKYNAGFDKFPKSLYVKLFKLEKKTGLPTTDFSDLFAKFSTSSIKKNK